MPRTVTVLLICLMLLAVLIHSAPAAVYWDNDTGNQRWEVPANWGGDNGPTAYCAIEIGEPNSPDECIIGPGVIADEPTKLWVPLNAGKTGSLLINGGELICNEFLEIGYQGEGTCTLKSGFITTELHDIRLAVGANTKATLNVQDGVITARRFFCPPLDPTGQATLNMSGGAIVVVDYDFGKGSGSTVVAGDFTINLSGGAIEPARDFYAGKDGVFLLEMTGGTINVPGVFFIASADTANSRVNLHGGAIQAGSLSINETAVSAQLDITEGMLVLDGDAASAVEGYVNAGLIAGYDGNGIVLVDHDVTYPGKTAVTAQYSNPHLAYGLAPVGFEPSLSAVLTWQAGLDADLHHVYFSTDFNAVDQRLLAADHGYQNSPYDPVSGDLQADQTYYWCVDEVNSVTSQAWPGEVVSFTTAQASLENDTYSVALLSDMSLRVTEKDSGASVDFAPEFTILHSSTDPRLAVGYVLAAEWSTGKNPFDSGVNCVLQAASVELVSGKLLFTFPEQPHFSLSAALEFSPEYSEPLLSYTLTANSAGWFMTAYTGSPSVDPETMEQIAQPTLWGEKFIKPANGGRFVFPSEPRSAPEHMVGLPAVLTRNNGLTCAAVVNPECQSFRVPHYRNYEFSLCIRNPAGNAQPIIFAPQMGSQGSHLPTDKDSYLSAGQTFSFSQLWVVDDAPWQDVYRHIAQDIYGVRDVRDNSGPGSMNKLLANLTDYALDADGGNYNMWDAEQKCNEYWTDQPGAFKILGVIFAINAAIVLDDEDMFWSRALPQLEYCLSRENTYFHPYDMEYNDQMTFSNEMNGPFICGIDLGNLYRLTGGRTTAFKTYSQEKGFTKSYGWFDQSLEWYRLYGNQEDLDYAIAGADYTLSNSYHVYDFQKFLEIYDETGDADFLAEAQEYAYNFVTTLNTSPKVPDGNITVDENNEAPIHFHSYGRHVAWGYDPPEPMYAPQQDVPAWRPSLIGMQPETYRAFTFSEFPGALLRLSGHLQDDFLRALARWAIVGRWANYPGQQFSTAHSLVYEQDDVCMHPLEYMTFTSMHFWHHWQHFFYAIDFLVNDTITKSQGNIDFPRRRIYDGGAGGRQNMWGADKGTFYGDEQVVLWMPHDLLTSSSPQVNYISGYGNCKLYLALSNQSTGALDDVTITLNPDRVAYDASRRAQVWEENTRQPDVLVSDGTVTVDIAPHGLTVLAIEDVKVTTGKVHQELFGTPAYSLAAESLSRTTQSFGKMVGMIISFGPELTEAYCYTDAKATFHEDGDTSHVTMHYSIDGGPLQSKDDAIFPFEFSVPFPLQPDSTGFEFYFEVYDADGTARVSSTETLDLTTTVSSTTISGRATTLDGDGIGAVLIQSSDSSTAFTSSNGYYTLPNVSDGLKVLTAEKSGHSFLPMSMPVDVQGISVANVNWIGVDDSLTQLNYLAFVVSDWLADAGANACGTPPIGDLNGDGNVDLADLARVP